jgi:hypothetical protein
MGTLSICLGRRFRDSFPTRTFTRVEGFLLHSQYNTLRKRTNERLRPICVVGCGAPCGETLTLRRISDQKEKISFQMLCVCVEASLRSDCIWMRHVRIACWYAYVVSSVLLPSH